MNYQPREPEVSGLDEYQRILSLLDERRFEEAQVRGRVLLESGEGNPLVRAKTHNLICWAFIEGLKRPAPEAVLHGEEAVALAEKLDNQPLLVEAALNLACAYYHIADYHSAQHTYERMITLLSANPALVPGGLAIAHQGLAQVETTNGLYQEALDRLQTAEQFCRDDENRFLLADLYRRRVLLLLKLNEPDLAARTLAQIPESAFGTGPKSLWWRTHLGFTTARVEMARGHFATARPMVVATLALAQELADLPVLAECTCLLALIDQAEGKKDTQRRARLALTYAIHSGRRDVVDDVRGRLQAYLLGDL